MGKNYYKLNLLNHAAPGFCTLTKGYYGSMSDFSRFISALKDDPKYADTYKEMIEAYNKYVGGYQNVEHHVAYGSEQFLSPVYLIRESNFVLKDYSWKHINIWGFDYFMKASEIEVKRKLFKVGREVVLCVKPTFKGLECGLDETDERRIEINSFWGHPGIYDYDPESKTIESRLYQVERAFEGYKTRREAIEEGIKLIEDNSSVCFKAPLDDIFGDG